MRNIIIILTAVVLFFANYQCYAQNDSLKIETEITKGDEQYYKNKYMYLDINLSDDHKLLKLGIQPFKPNDNYNFAVFTIHCGYEQKLNTSFSLISEVNTSIISTEEEALLQFGYSFGGRYYPFKKQQLTKERSGDNCNGSYLHFRMSDLLSLNTLRSNSTVGNRNELLRVFDYALKPELGFGIQQKIKRNIYFDANFSTNYDIINKEFGFRITFLFGGLLSFNN